MILYLGRDLHHRLHIELRLLRDPGYFRFWSAYSVSELGSGVGSLALSLTAVVTLQATAEQMGLLLALTNAPSFLLALVAGVWIDRLRRRPLLVAADVGRAALLGLVPLAVVTGVLRIELLYTLAFLVGTLTVLFDLAATSYLPALVGRTDLVEANSKLALSRSSAQLAGPAAGGWLIQTVTAPFALLADAASFVISGVLIASIRTPETRPSASGRRPFWREAIEGAQPLWNDPLLRATTATAGIGALGWGIQSALIILFASRELGLSASAVGLVLSSFGAAALFGAAVAARVTAWSGIGRALLAGQSAIMVGMLLVPGAALVPSFAVPVLGFAQLLIGAGMTIFSINQISLRQAITAAEVLGRVNATRRFFVFGIQPVGALVGGALGSMLGLTPALLIGGCVQFLSLAVLLRSPVRSLRTSTA